MSYHSTKYLFILFMGTLLLTGCDFHSAQQESYLEAAENAYRSGQYEIAHQNYSAFLKQNPDPQLARLAERRIRAIGREVKTVLGQESGPRPAYVNQEGSRGTAPSKHPSVINKSEKPVRMPSYE